MSSLATHSPALDVATFAKQDSEAASVTAIQTAPDEIVAVVKKGPLDMALILRQALRVNPAVSRVLVAQFGLAAVYVRAAGFWSAKVA